MKVMRRHKQALQEKEIEEILYRNTSGVLALADSNAAPYAVPISYVFTKNKLYFHCAKTGYKLDLIQANAKASFCVIDKDEIVPEAFTTYYRSVIVCGEIHIITDETEKGAALHKLAKKYAPHSTKEEQSQEIHRFLGSVCVLCLTIDEMSGKEAIELVEKKEKGKH